MALHLLAVGEVVVDVAAEALPLRGERVHRPVRASPGGSPVTAALAAARVGARAGVVGRVGDDWLGRALGEELARTGVEPFLAVDPRDPTGAVVTLAGQERSVVAGPAAAASLEPSDLDHAPDAAAVLVSGYSLLADGPAAAAAAAALARGGTAWTAADAASARRIRSLGAERASERLRPADALLASADEAEALTGEADPEGAAHALARGRRLACVTLGPDGAVAVLDGELLRAAPQERIDGDVVGAGDAFAGVLLALLTLGEEPQAALERACAEAVRSHD